MSKFKSEAALRDHYSKMGLTTETSEFDKQLREINAQRQASYESVPVQRNAAVDAWFDQHCSCTGCCGHDEHNPENNSSCCIIL